jgi:hypothetical protein
MEVCERVFSPRAPGEVIFEIGTLGFAVISVMVVVLLMIYYLIVWSEYETT